MIYRYSKCGFICRFLDLFEEEIYGRNCPIWNEEFDARNVTNHYPVSASATKLVTDQLSLSTLSPPSVPSIESPLSADASITPSPLDSRFAPRIGCFDARLKRVEM